MTLKRTTKPIFDNQDTGPAERTALAERTASAESIAPAASAAPAEGGVQPAHSPEAWLASADPAAAGGARPDPSSTAWLASTDPAAAGGARPDPLPAVWPATTGLAHEVPGRCLVPITVPFRRYCLQLIFRVAGGLEVVAGELLYPPAVQHPEHYNQTLLAQRHRLHLARDHRQVMQGSVAPVPEGLTLAMNLHGFEVGEDEALLMTGVQLGRPLERVLLEVPETESVDSIVACQAGYRQLKALRHRLALDDLRGCYEDMQRLVALEPDVVKLDKALAPYLETSLLVRSLIGRFLELCRMEGVTVILEGAATLGQLVAAAPWA